MYVPVLKTIKNVQLITDFKIAIQHNSVFMSKLTTELDLTMSDYLDIIIDFYHR